MEKLEIPARAKINLTLDVLYKRPDGYYEVEMIMQTIGLKDIIKIEPLSRKAIKLGTNCSKLPTDEGNLVYRAAALMIREYKLDAGVNIIIHKNIPLAAGLAGGSSDAAAVIIGINELFDLKKPQEELMSLGEKIGADVPFCIMGGTAVARGIGEQLQPIKPLSGLGVLLVKPSYEISTKEVYNRLDVKNIKKHPNTRTMINHIERQNFSGIAQNLCNVLEEVTCKLYPELYNIKDILIKEGALGSLMSGSGPTVFGLFENMEDAKRAAANIHCSDACVIITEVK